MTIRDLIEDGIDIQSRCHYCYYDYDKEKRIEMDVDQVYDYNITYIYVENSELYIEFN